MSDLIGTLVERLTKTVESQAKRIAELESQLSDAIEAQQVLGLKLAQVEAERDALKVALQEWNAAAMEIAQTATSARKEQQ